MPDHGSSPTRLKVGEFIIDRGDERLIGPGGPVKLGQKAYRLLNMFADQPNMLVTKDAIFSSVWDGTFVSESALTSTVKELRRALGDLSKTPSYIESVYGRGYRLIASVGEAGQSPTRPAATIGKAPPVSSPPIILSDEPPTVIVSEFNDAAVLQALPYLGAGLREEILSSLAQFREIQLIANSHFDERNPQLASPERSYHLTATLLPDRGSAKIIARIKRVSDGRVLWAENMSLADAGAAEGVDRIIKRVASSLLPTLDHDLIVGVGRHGRTLFERYLVAKQAIWNVQSYDAAKQAADELEAIIAERPDFALAYGPLVRLYNSDFYFTAIGTSTPAVRKRAMELAKAGLAADRNHAHNHSVMGWCLLRSGQFERAEDAFEQTLARNPYNYDRVNEVSTAMIFLGHFDRARSLAEVCRGMAPWEDSLELEDEGLLFLLEGNYAAARASLLAMTRPGPLTGLLLALAEFAMGERTATDHLDEWMQGIRSRWHGDGPPTNQAIRNWIQTTLPFRGDAGKPLFNLLDEALA